MDQATIRGFVIAIVCGAAVLAAVRYTADVRVLPPDAVLPDGGRYDGAVRDGRFHGEGTLTWPTGARYDGAFADGLFHGEGRYRFDDGDVYEGEFVEGLFQGQGRFTTTRGELYEGRFADNRIVHGIHRDGRGNVYEGEFEAWDFHGEGVFTAASGDVYRGTFERGLLHGEGVHEAPSGLHYEGEFRDWVYHGQGTLTEPDGDRYTGSFENGYRHGAGRMVEADGTVHEGEWQWGRPSDGDNAERRRSAEAVERALYRQPELLQTALDDVAPGHPGTIDLFFVGVAPDGGQDVFRKEIDFVAARFAEDFGAGGRTVILGNHPDTLDARPMATHTSLRRTLEHVDAAMDDDDILFLYVTTHGSENHELAVDHPGITLPDIGAGALSAMIDGLTARWKIVTISACYSGGYLPGLRDRDHLVMTAASAERASFGCGDDSDMTYFGRAFFDEALDPGESFRDVFDRAAGLVEEWEEEEGIEEHSRPRIAMGEAIAEHLERWRSTRREAAQ